MRGQLNTQNLEALKEVVLAGRADITLENEQTGGRFTFKISAPSRKTEAGGFSLEREANVRFVKVLTGRDNENDFSFMGTIFMDSGEFRLSPKSKISAEATSAKAWSWFWTHVTHNKELPACVKVWHEGKCCRCGRKLTVPESIEAGYGPECRSKIGC
jgi:hypothetical protein